MKITHATNPAGGYEYTMCGVAFDAHDSGDAAEEIHIAADGEAVTCPECRRVVLEVRKIKLGRLPSNAPHEGPARASCAGPLDAVVGHQ